MLLHLTATYLIGTFLFLTAVLVILELHTCCCKAACCFLPVMIPNLRHSSFVSQRLLRGIRKNFPVDFKSQLFFAQALVAIALSLEEYLGHGLLAL